MVTARYSNEQGSKSRQTFCQVQPTENIGNYRRQDDVFGYGLQFLLEYLECCQYCRTSITSYREYCLRSCPTNNTLIKSYTKCILALGGLHEDQLCDILQAMAPTNVGVAHQNPYFTSRATLIDSDCCRLPTASVLSKKVDKLRSNQF